MMAIDRLGVLNVFQYETGPLAEWQGPQLVGFATLIPGSLLAMFAQSQSLYAALMIDGSGTINVASYDVAAGSLGMETIGDARFMPGSIITIFAPTPTSHMALLIDRNGVFNSLSVDAPGFRSQVQRG
jgi:hypothetical protein